MLFDFFKKIPEDIMLIDKPKGISSFDVIRQLRKELEIRKIGHAGTLDPLASGLMIIGVGKGTKKLNDFIKLDKVYDAEIILGEKRSTGDLEGEIIKEREVSLEDVSKEEIKKTLKEMRGVLKLSVPAYSAVKKEGKRLYELARKGQSVETPIKDMKVYSSHLDRIEKKGKRVHVFVKFHVGSGTYIRSLAEELGNKLNLPATLGNLRRTKVGKFKIKWARGI